jgi:hypothetical protein
MASLCLSWASPAALPPALLPLPPVLCLQLAPAGAGRSAEVQAVMMSPQGTSELASKYYSRIANLAECVMKPLVHVDKIRSNGCQGKEKESVCLPAYRLLLMMFVSKRARRHVQSGHRSDPDLRSDHRAHKRSKPNGSARPSPSAPA